MKKLGTIAAGVCSVGLAVGGLAVSHGSARAAGNCHAYGPTGVAANRAISAACKEVGKGTQYSWAGGHAARPGPSTGTVHHENGVRYDDRNRVGLDCSGLVRWAWYQATGTDFGAGSSWAMPAELTSHGFTRIDGTRPTRPGDVIVYRGHTAIYLGQGLVVQAANHTAGLNVAGLATEPSSVTGVFRYTGHATPRRESKQPPKHTTPPRRESTPTHTPRPTPKPTPKSKPTSTAKPTPRPKPTSPKPKQPKTTPKPKSKPKATSTSGRYQQVRADAPTYLAPVAWHDVGVLGKGRRHFDCQVLSLGHSFRGKHSNWWLKTDDTSGNHNVWVSAAYLSKGSKGTDNNRVPGVPIC